MFRANETGELIGWQQLTVFPELFHAMDILNVCPEELPKYTGIYDWDASSKVLDNSKKFIPEYICSANRYMVASVLEGIVPPPNLIIHTSQPCDSGAGIYPALSAYLNIPMFSFDMPYWADERTNEYIADQVASLVEFLEKTTKRKLDYDRLRQVMEYSNQAQFYKNAIYELGKTKPCPIGGKLLHRMEQAWRELTGLPGLVDYFGKIHQFAKENVLNGRGFLPEEKIRLGYVYVQHGIYGDLVNWMEDEYKANIVIDYMTPRNMVIFEDLSTPRKMFKALAYKLTNMPMGYQSRGPASYYLDTMVNMCRDFKVDAAVFGGHVACKQNWAMVALLRDKLRDELSIPMLAFEYDLFDPRVATKEEVKEKLDTFLSTMF
jgi:benzoyl-CoA reductase/2-hydroxyglutaryl-CoA dehydratase subunit BcrC/BadD/HgdB